jgi:hypothetical protein
MKYVKKLMSTLLSEFHALAWTLAGAVTVLITLSGATQQQGLWITLIALCVHLFGVTCKAFFNKEDNENN